MVDQSKGLFAEDDTSAHVPTTVTQSAPKETEKDVGSALKSARERKGVDLAQVSKDLCIREDFLDAIEGRRQEDLPGVPYAIGFIRSYADYLNLDPGEMVSRFKAEIAEQDQEEAEAEQEQAPPARSKSGRSIYALLAVVLVAAAGYGAYEYLWKSGVIANLIGTKTQSSTTTAKNNSAIGLNKNATNGSRATTQPTAVVGVKPKAAPIAKKTKGENAARTAVPPAKPAVTSIARAPTSPKAAATVTTGTTAAKKPSVKKPPVAAPVVANIPAKHPDQVVIVAKANTWISIRQKTGQVVFSRIMRAGDHYAVPATKGLVMNVGNAGMATLFVGGKAVKPVGQAAMPAYNISLDPAALRAR